jgi:hypothetical protein
MDVGNNRSSVWTDIICCPHCNNTLEVVPNKAPEQQSLKCINCKTEFMGVSGSFDLAVADGEREKESAFYQQNYSARQSSVSVEFAPEELSRRWADPHWPESRLMLDQLGDINNKVVLCLGNGASTKELYFLELGAKLICSDLSLSGALAVKSKYDLGELADNAAFHAMDAVQALRSDIPSRLQTSLTTLRRLAGTRSFPPPLLSKSIYPMPDQLQAFAVDRSLFEQPLTAWPCRDSCRRTSAASDNKSAAIFQFPCIHLERFCLDRAKHLPDVTLPRFVGH